MLLVKGFSKTFQFYFILFFTNIFISCENKSMNVSDPVIVIPGMRSIQSMGKSYYLGTDDTLAQFDERPSMKVTFTYNFTIDSTEVTQGDFVKLGLTNPVPESSKFGVGSDFPVYNVSWFDAILFCNYRSKNEKLDTVYSYCVIKKKNNGSVNDIIGLTIDYQKDGYRLPTEAEWEYCAGFEQSKNSYIKIAWYMGNSSGSTHQVATKAPNSIGIYDMIGNVFEWTNDWKGLHKKGNFSNVVGVREPDPEYEKVIKGGSFKDGNVNLTIYCRSDIYPTSASASTEYIGFRCVRGIIPQQEYISIDSSGTFTNPAVIVSTNMESFAGTTIARLVYVNITNSKRTLCYIDYADVHPKIHEFFDIHNVYAPVISPDGRFVAYCNSDEGIKSTSANVFIRSLDSVNLPPVKIDADSAFVPRWVVNYTTKTDTLLVYTNSVVDNNQQEWTATKTYSQKIKNGKPVGLSEIIISDGSFHDGISNNNVYAVSGNSHLILRDLVHKTNKVLFLPPLNGKQLNESSQVCNVSMCQDYAYSGYCLFLDFGSLQQSTLTNDSYNAHQYLFISDPNGKIVKYIKKPEAEESWEYPEWSNKLNYAVSSAESKNGQKNNIYLVNVNNSKYERLIKGGDLVQPYLWISQKTVISSDSLGRYDLPVEYGSIYNCRMRGFWHHHNDMEILFLGTSHTAFHIDTREFSKKVYNMGIPSIKYADVNFFVMNYVRNHCPNIKVLGIDLFLCGLFASEIPVISSNVGFEFDKSHNFWVDSFPSDFIQKLDRIDLDLSGVGFVDTMNLFDLNCGGWGPLGASGVKKSIEDPAFKKNFEILKSICDTFSRKGVHVLFYITPENPLYKGTNDFGPIGPDRNTADTIIALVNNLIASNPYIHLYDANLNGDHDYTNDEARDGSHLCTKGAKKFSKRLDLVVENMLMK